MFKFGWAMYNGGSGHSGLQGMRGLRVPIIKCGGEYYINSSVLRMFHVIFYGLEYYHFSANAFENIELE